jgi:hypothetical protein
MSNNLYSKDPFGVFSKNISSANSSDSPKPNYQKPKSESKYSWWEIIGFFLLIISFGLIFYFKESLVAGFKKTVAKVNDKVNPELKNEPLAEEKIPEPKLLTQSVEPKIECIFPVGDKANWDIAYINKKTEEHKAIYSDEEGWIIYE